MAEGVDMRGSGEETELASKTLQIQAKRFYIDVKQNSRGRFIKFAEVGGGGQKSRILMAMSVAQEFRDHLTQFSDFYASLGPSDKPPDDGLLKSVTISRDVLSRRYYLDLKENQRGRFLRVAQTTSRGPRIQIAIPAQGLVEFRDALTGLLDEFGTDDGDLREFDLPESRLLKAENKIFYFDVGRNRRGVFLRVSEVRPTLRTAVTIPEGAWERFRDILNEFVDKAGTTQGASGGAGNAEAASADHMSKETSQGGAGDGPTEATSAGGVSTGSDKE